MEYQSERKQTSSLGSRYICYQTKWSRSTCHVRLDDQGKIFLPLGSKCIDHCGLGWYVVVYKYLHFSYCTTINAHQQRQQFQCKSNKIFRENQDSSKLISLVSTQFGRSHSHTHTHTHCYLHEHTISNEMQPKIVCNCSLLINYC